MNFETSVWDDTFSDITVRKDKKEVTSVGQAFHEAMFVEAYSSTTCSFDSLKVAVMYLMIIGKITIETYNLVCPTFPVGKQGIVKGKKESYSTLRDDIRHFYRINRKWYVSWIIAMIMMDRIIKRYSFCSVKEFLEYLDSNIEMEYPSWFIMRKKMLLEGTKMLKKHDNMLIEVDEKGSCIIRVIDKKTNSICNSDDMIIADKALDRSVHETANSEEMKLYYKRKSKKDIYVCIDLVSGDVDEDVVVKFLSTDAEGYEYVEKGGIVFYLKGGNEYPVCSYEEEKVYIANDCGLISHEEKIEMLHWPFLYRKTKGKNEEVNFEQTKCSDEDAMRILWKAILKKANILPKDAESFLEYCYDFAIPPKTSSFKELFDHLHLFHTRNDVVDDININKKNIKYLERIISWFMSNGCEKEESATELMYCFFRGAFYWMKRYGKDYEDILIKLQIIENQVMRRDLLYMFRTQPQEFWESWFVT